MNKSELVEEISKQADLPKSTAARALEAAITAIKTSLRRGGGVTLIGFGTFYVQERASRSGRNPRTGASIDIKEARVPKFRAGKGLRDELN